MAELQYAKRTVLSSAMKKLDKAQKSIMSSIVDATYRRLVEVDPQINKTDVMQLFAALGAFVALKDPLSTRSS